DYDSANAVTSDSAGNVIVVGSFKGAVTAGTYSFTSAGNNDGYIIKYTPAGDLVWARQVGGAGADNIKSVAVDSAGDVVVVGNFGGTAQFGGASFTASGPNDMF